MSAKTSKHKTASFKTKLAKFTAESGWHFVEVSKKVADGFDFEKGSRRVICTLNDAQPFQCALMPYAGDFFIMVNKGVRTKLRIEEGDTVTVVLEKDESKYGLPMPEEFREVLNQDPDGDKMFHALTAGKQRSLLYVVGKIKDIDKRIHACLVIVDHLRENDGKIVGDRLYHELKRPVF
jgi:hypothetical protein